MTRMVRTQIHLAEAEVALLDEESRRTGASRAELIRRAIRTVYGGGSQSQLPTSVGIIADGSFDAEQVDEELAEIFEERWKRWHA
jgi:metal-responsive CopG/Arc/MetJ family transcriptional regulator